MPAATVPDTGTTLSAVGRPPVAAFEALISREQR
jgi:hypothetical protein